MNRLSFTALALLCASVFSSPAQACQCVWKGPFAKVQADSDVVLLGKVSSYRGNAFDLKVEEVMRGDEWRDTVRVWTDTGSLCRPSVGSFDIGAEYVLALDKIREVPDDGFNPFTPNFSYGRVGDFSISNCGVYWLKREHSFVSGNLASGSRWQMQDNSKSPVLLSLLRSFLKGESEFEALEEAEKPQQALRELKQMTRTARAGSEVPLQDLLIDEIERNGGVTNPDNEEFIQGLKILLELEEGIDQGSNEEAAEAEASQEQ